MAPTPFRRPASHAVSHAPGRDSTLGAWPTVSGATGLLPRRHAPGRCCGAGALLIVTKLVDAFLDELAADPAALDRLRTLVGYRDESWPALMSVARVAELLDCSPTTVRRRIREGNVPAVRDPGGRLAVRGDDLRAYVDRMERIGARPGLRPRARHTRRYDFLREP